MPDALNRQNPQSFCGVCSWLWKCFPVIIAVGIMVWSYYTYVQLFCMSTVEVRSERIVYLSIFHILFLLLFISYCRTVCTRPGKVPEFFRIPETEADSTVSVSELLEEFSQTMGVNTRTAAGEFRYCVKCHQLKPDRTHHCNTCGRCVLKMDHHCPWINNCVGFTNYKFFMLFLFYCVLYIIFIIATTVPYCITLWRQQVITSTTVHIYIVCLAAVMFLITVAPLLFYHCYLVAKNRSTLEAYRAPVFQHGVDKSAFNLGISKNFMDVFGENCLLWFIPVNTTLGDGIHFQLRIQTSGRRYDAMGRSEDCMKRRNNQ